MKKKTSARSAEKNLAIWSVLGSNFGAKRREKFGDLEPMLGREKCVYLGKTSGKRLTGRWSFVPGFKNLKCNRFCNVTEIDLPIFGYTSRGYCGGGFPLHGYRPDL